MTPEPNESNIELWGKAVPRDPITEKLNQFREKKNKQPLPAFLPMLTTSRFLNDASNTWEALESGHEESTQSPAPPQEIRRRRTQTPEATHCNVKYLIEELDYIRYQRVDLGLKWAVVENKFCTKFPMTKFPRKAQGLQGVNYRQNKFLPNIINDRLVFMENGHVEPICIQTRHQTAQKHLFTLVYLYPGHSQRQREMEQAQLSAQRLGTYIEKLPADSPCGCCPGEDRERDKSKRADNQKATKKDEEEHAPEVVRARL
ncbi:hypothetical protein ONZ43_g1287 [Nemania bipapillata]|uniref:Uncharacterized protein n=1 Tax=Nemania bipapillata TaxID=110536 RepID=A0ACC2J5C1_9PEZI|nr:hypothetical protein ONZ43_g1287 [Nemania bipapillata]